MKKLAFATFLYGLMVYSPEALAYIGPGLGSGVIAGVFGVLVGLFLLLVGAVWYPMKRLVRWLRAKKD